MSAKPSSQTRVSAILSLQRKAELDHVQKQLELSNQGDTIAVLIDAYRELQDLKKHSLELTLSEQDEVDKAVERSGMSLDQLTKRGLLKEARTALSLAKLQERLEDTDPAKLKTMTFRGVASTRIEQVIKKIMDYNDTRGEQKDRYCISETLVAKLSGSNRNAVREYFNSHKIMIDDHNAKYNLTNNDNRKGKGIDAKQVFSL